MGRRPCAGAVALVALALFVLAGTSLAAGLPSGYGVRNRALAGAGAALHLDPMAGQLNPGAMPFVFPGWDVSLTVEIVDAGTRVTGEPSGAADRYGLASGAHPADTGLRFAPTLARQWTLNEDETWTLGVVLHGVFSAATSYPEPLYEPGASIPRTGTEVHRAFLEPTLGLLVAERHGLGVTPIVAYQTYQAEGLSPFGDRGWSRDPAALTDNGASGAFGYGLRVGYLGELLGFMSVGGAYRTRIAVESHTDYAGWLAEDGSLDLPAAWTAGVAFGFPGMGMAVDVERILYAGVRSLGNPLLPNLEDARLGDADGAGFGWRDVTRVKLGGWYRTNGGWMFRIGFATGDSPVLAEQTYLGALAPETTKSRLTFGVAHPVGFDKEINVYVGHGFSATVEGENPLETSGQQTIALDQSTWEVGLGLTF